MLSTDGVSIVLLLWGAGPLMCAVTAPCLALTGGGEMNATRKGQLTKEQVTSRDLMADWGDESRH